MTMSVFDSLAKVAVGVTSSLFGDVCTWVKDGSNTYTAKVKYKDEKGDAKMGDVKYNLNHWSIVIVDSDFPGLKGLVDQLKKPMVTVNVRGVNTDFICMEVYPLSDGRCVKIKMQLKP